MGLFNKGLDITKYNLLNKDNQKIPRKNYDILKKEVYFELYFSPDMEICITGQLDNNYIVWCSITKLSDVEINAKIFDHVANYNFQMVSDQFSVLGAENYNKIFDWYRCRISRSTQSNNLWDTPFDHKYRNPKENYGNIFSRDIEVLFNNLIKKCEYRICCGSYLDILKSYYDILIKDSNYDYYYKMEPLITIIKEESYLRLCPDEKIRALYVNCLKVCSQLYNRYMSVAR